MRNFLLTFTIALVTLTLAPTMTEAVTWYVKPDGTGDAATIQDAINAASNGDIVLLSAGTFTGVGNFDIQYFGKAITVTSESGPEFSIIDCQGNGRGFRFRNGETAGSILDGVTITNGDAGGGKGGGIELIDVAAQILNNILVGNTAAAGGGIYIDRSSPDIQNNIFRNNTSATEGGGIFIENTTGVVSFNLVEGNTATQEGGGMYVKTNSAIVANNTVVYNSASVGGGIAVDVGATPMIQYNIIAFNTAGGGFACITSTPSLACNDIFGNVGGDGFCGIDLGNNVSSDPDFCGIPGSSNYFLQSDSPCAPGLSVCGVLIGAWNVNCGSVATHQRTWGSMKAMFE